MNKYINKPDNVNEVLDYVDKRTTLAFDTETNTLDPREGDLLLIQVGDRLTQFVLDVYLLGKSIHRILDLIIEKRVVLAAHNAKFDYLMIKGHLGVELDVWVDTMLAEQLLNQGKNKVRFSLGALLEKYLNVVVNKAMQKSFIDHEFGKPFSHEQLLYAGEDVEHLIPLHNKLNKLLAMRNMLELAELEYHTITASGDIEFNGIFINKKEWLKLKDLAEKEARNWKIKLDSHFMEFATPDLFGDLGINYNSPKQVAPMLEKVCKMKIKSTADAALKHFSAQYPAINDLLEYRKAVKKVTTYGSKFLEDHVNKTTGRIHSTFLQLGADSGRYASRNPNLQNVPREQIYRTPFQAQDKDWRIISADFQQQELRLLAELSKEPVFLEALKKGLDLHCVSASLIYDIPYEDFIDPDTGSPWKKAKNKKMATLRDNTKAINFGIIYGMGPMRLAKTLGITMGEAKILLSKYFVTFPRVKELLDKLSSDATKNRYALSPLDNRRRDLSDFDWDNPRHVGHAVNIAKNLPFQGCGASTTKLALVKTKYQIKNQKLRAKIVNVVHDEMVIEVHKDDAEEIAKIVRTGMIKAFNHYAPSVPMEVDAIIDNHWVH